MTVAKVIEWTVVVSLVPFLLIGFALGLVLAALFGGGKAALDWLGSL